MADSIEMADIRRLDTDTALTGYALTAYTFKQLLRQQNTNGDTIRTYARTAGDLAAQGPITIKTSRLAVPVTLEQTYTRTTVTPVMYKAEVFISMEDLKTSDIDLYSEHLRDLMRAVAKVVDADIYNVLSENQSASNINSVAATAAWDAASGQNPIKDISNAKRLINENNYDGEQAVLLLSPKDYDSLVVWLVANKGVNFTNYASQKLVDGSITQILNVGIRVSNQVVADSALMMIPQRSGKWYTQFAPTSDTFVDAGLGTRIRVWEGGVAVLTDPKSVTLITNTQA